MRCDLVVMLLPANRTEQPFWQRLVEPFRDRAPLDGITLTSRFLPGRLRFGMPASYQLARSRKGGDRPPFGCLLLTWSRV